MRLSITLCLCACLSEALALKAFAQVDHIELEVRELYRNVLYIKTVLNCGAYNNEFIGRGTVLYSDDQSTVVLTALHVLFPEQSRLQGAIDAAEPCDFHNLFVAIDDEVVLASVALSDTFGEGVFSRSSVVRNELLGIAYVSDDIEPTEDIALVEIPAGAMNERRWVSVDMQCPDLVHRQVIGRQQPFIHSGRAQGLVSSKAKTFDLHEWNAEKDVCPGDSGGPVLRAIDDFQCSSTAVFGVISQISKQNDYGVRQDCNAQFFGPNVEDLWRLVFANPDRFEQDRDHVLFKGARVHDFKDFDGDLALLGQLARSLLNDNCACDTYAQTRLNWVEANNELLFDIQRRDAPATVREAIETQEAADSEAVVLGRDAVRSAIKAVEDPNRAMNDVVDQIRNNLF